MNRIKKNKYFADWLVELLGEDVIKGTEQMDRYKNYAPLAGKGYLGITEYGTQKIDGVTCMKIGLRDAVAVESIGWKIVDRKTHYAYVIPPEAK